MFYKKYPDLKIPQIVDYFYDSEKNLWLVKDYLEGTSLHLFASECAVQFFSPFNNIDFFQVYLIIINQMIKITDSFHKKNLILNDVKLSNFLVNKNLEIYFIDPEHSYKLTEHNSFYHQILSPYFSKVFLKNQHAKLDYYKLGMTIIDFICGSSLYVKLDSSLKKMFNYLTDIFNYHNFDLKLLNLINQPIFHPEKVNLVKFQKQLINIQNEYQFDSNWIPHFSDGILSKIKEQIVALNKSYKKNNWKLNKKTKLRKFVDFLIYFDQYENLSISEKLLLKQKLLKINNSFYCEMLLLILENIHNSPDSDVQKQFKTKIQNYIKINLFKFNGIYYIKKNVYIPYIEDGTAGLCLILIYGKYYLKIDDFNQLIGEIISTIKSPFIQKASFQYGLSGFAFLYLKAHQLWKSSQNYLMEALECFYFLVHQMIDHKTIYDYDYTKLSLKDRKSLKYIASQLYKILFLNKNELLIDKNE